MSVFYEKKESNLWFGIGFLLPIVGLILYFVYKETNLARAKKCLYGVISIAIAAVFVTIIVVLYFVNLDPAFRVAAEVLGLN